ncbi:MAG: diguanylate cyclase [Pseudomonadota bacterium]
MALPVLFALIALELSRHSGGYAAWPLLACIVLVLAVWLARLGGMGWAMRFGDDMADAVLLLLLLGCVLPGLDDATARTVTARLLFWSPLICAWWAYRHRRQPARLVGSVALLFAGLLVAHAAHPGELGVHLLLAGLGGGLVWQVAGRTPPGDEPTHQSARKGQLDAMTSLPSPERFEDELALTVAVADRYRIPFSLLKCEIQGLAEHAAEAGDKAALATIQNFAWTIADELRIADTLCRWENGKFFILLPNTDILGSRKLISRIRRVVRENPLPGNGPSEIRVGIHQHRFGDDPMTTFSLAEAAMPLEGAPHSGNCHGLAPLA